MLVFISMHTHLIIPSLHFAAGKGGPSQQEQARLWKAFLEYERSNPQRLEQTALTQRVELAYMQALMCLLHFPEVRRLTD
jgi:cleavage stimulation factor subunit 3